MSLDFLRERHAARMPLQVDVWRSPAASGGKTGAPVRVLTRIPANIVPADLDGENTTAPLGLSGDRGDHVGYLRYGTAVREADELRLTIRGVAHRYKVESVARNVDDAQLSAWSTAVVVALSKVRT